MLTFPPPTEGTICISHGALSALAAKPAALMIYAELCRHLEPGEPNVVFPVRRELAKTLGHKAPHGVDRAVHVLEAAGLVGKIVRFCATDDSGDRDESRWVGTRSKEYPTQISNGYYLRFEPGEPFDGAMSPDMVAAVLNGMEV